MLFRFSLYGFLKNQRYFEPFLMLVFLEKGMSFFAIGLLVAFREACINLLGIPTGAIADVCGRRRAMILSFAAYIVSFVVFAFSANAPLLYLAMGLFAVGESFREGTHKAMIFTWLRIHGREAERTRIYGYTRSWSQIGSAVSVALAAIFVIATDGYRYVFLFAIVPYALGIVNFLSYPAELDGDLDERAGVRAVAAHLKEAVGQSLRKPGLRRLMLESMGFEGVFKAVKDYLQPVIKAAAAGALAASGVWFFSAGGGWSETQRSAALVGIVYFALYLLSAWGSRQAHRLSDRLGGDEGSSRALWLAAAALYGAVLVGGWFGATGVLIAAFALLHVAQSAWRPTIISRFDDQAEERQGATVLSIEGQAQGLATLGLAPIVGLAIDAVRKAEFGGPFWPAGAAGLAIAAAFIVWPPKRTADGAPGAAAQPLPPGA